ncbi:MULTISPECIES: helix-turn-helix domain-containing protein [Actinoalloteichus]|uniref:DNA-binding protein, excisionase family n=1 Tax=Actinoalloteichus fjordicus TaxID=1612552 RepID=A0AAC9PU25_9PSEU|nr:MULTISPECIES: helix-turn-helix domain-containing protein [Actinoalloteichus]APU16672.1 DNA-binding protein, excisionase family [Actinoalloteichus fjordicus]APU22738.1 DNA-binding protein, excisionase family [Actinoalloteichus sp. GBA129-24]
MSEDMLSVEQVADRLGLHVRTVRGYIRSGRLPAVRIGKQYRIAPADLQALLGRPEPRPARVAAPEVSSIVQIDGVSPASADRLGTLVLASVNTARDPARPLRLQTVYDQERHRMKIVILGCLAESAEVLRLLDSVLDGDNGLLTSEVDGD